MVNYSKYTASTPVELKTRNLCLFGYFETLSQQYPLSRFFLQKCLKHWRVSSFSIFLQAFFIGSLWKTANKHTEFQPKRITFKIHFFLISAYAFSFWIQIAEFGWGGGDYGIERSCILLIVYRWYQWVYFNNWIYVCKSMFLFKTWYL